MNCGVCRGDGVVRLLRIWHRLNVEDVECLVVCCSRSKRRMMMELGMAVYEVICAGMQNPVCFARFGAPYAPSLAPSHRAPNPGAPVPPLVPSAKIFKWRLVFFSLFYIRKVSKKFYFWITRNKRALLPIMVAGT